MLAHKRARQGAWPLRSIEASEPGRSLATAFLFFSSLFFLLFYLFLLNK
jgi:hypothetical protein